VRFVGDYEILAELGRGAMGVVYKARDTKLGRLVALKMIRSAGHASSAEVHRFLAEARAEALLDHPHIVPIYDVGEADCLPYFAMALVEGSSLQDLLNEGPLPAKVAARLMRQVAEAVQHAHDRGVIHRDLKPQNILLQREAGSAPGSAAVAGTAGDTGRPGSSDQAAPRAAGTWVPKVSDFGLARLAGHDGLTGTGEVLGTPSYMPPEQADGRSKGVEPRADVYSLGAVLYSLLTGRPPFQAATPAETMRLVRDHDPIHPRRFNTGVPRDLDTICLKCLEKEPAKRYASAAALAEDLRRFGEGEPILAAPAGLLTRSAKWVRRHREVAALLALVVMITAVGFGLVTSLWLDNRAARVRADDARVRAESALAEADTQRIRAEENFRQTRLAVLEAEQQKKRAEENFRQTRQAVDRYFTLVSENRLLDVAGSGALRKELLGAALEYYQKFPKAESEDAEVQAELAAAYFRMAQIQHQTGSADWLPAAEKGADILTRLVAANTPVDKLKSLDAGIAKFAGDTLNVDPASVPRVRAAFERLASAYEQLVAARPASIGFRNDLSLDLTVLGHLNRYEAFIAFQAKDSLRAALMLSKALAFYSRALGLLQALSKEHPEIPQLRAETAIAYGNAGTVYADMKKYREATDRFRTAVDIGEELITAHPDVPSFQFDGATRYVFLADCYVNSGNIRESFKPLRRSIAIREKMVERFPLVRTYADALGSAYDNAAGYLNRSLAAKPDEQVFLAAFELYAEVKEKKEARRVKALHEPAAPGDRLTPPPIPPGATYPVAPSCLDGVAIGPLSTMFFRAPKPVRDALLEGISRRARTAGTPGRKTYRFAEITLRWWAGERPAAVKLLEAFAAETPDDPELKDALEVALGKALPLLEEKAVALLEEALEKRKATLGPDHPDTLGTMASLGLVLLQQKKWADAEPVLRDCLARRQKAIPDAWPTFNTQSLLGGALLGQKKYAEAEPLLLKGYEGMKTREQTIPTQGGAEARIPEALDRLIELYTAINKPDEAKKWQAERAKYLDTAPGPGEKKLARSSVQKGTSQESVTVANTAREQKDPDRRAAEYVLSIGGNVRVDGNERDIGAPGDLPAGAIRLTHVHLDRNNPVTDSGLAAFKDCKNLKGLDIYGPKAVTDAGLAHFKDCKKLELLALHATSVTNAGLALFKDCENLGHLDLWGCPQVTDAGCIPFKDFKKLKFLQLGDTGVTDAGLAHLKDCKNLNTLYLDGNRVTDAGLADLVGLTELTYLKLTRTKVTAKGVEGLAKALLKCKIEWDGGVIQP
jgi:tetratricopeptide (TPR) repeat protein